MSVDEQRHRALDKCLRLATLLAGQTALPPFEQLAAKLGGCSTRTIRRYLVALQRAGWTVPPFPGRRWQKKTSRAAQLDAVPLMPTRIQRRRARGWRMPEGVLYVGRPTRFANPYRVSSYKFETADGRPTRDDKSAREMAVRDFRMWLEVTARGREMAAEARRTLRGRDLACWCPIGQPCHADVLLEIANA